LHRGTTRPEQVAEAAIREGVVMIGHSLLAGVHSAWCPRVIDLLEGRGAARGRRMSADDRCDPGLRRR
jgi:methylmalonyl-CoA mutase cobalamin-binding subunit